MKTLLTLLLFICTNCWGSGSPYEQESRVRSEVENMLSRLMEPRQFLVQVNADVQMESERKVVEGETVTDGIERNRVIEQPRTMPGFVPESDDISPPQPFQTRKVFKTVEKPKLAGLRVHVTLDEQISRRTSEHARVLIQDYLFNNYPGLGRLKFVSVPMLQPKVVEAPAPVPEKTFLEKAWEWFPWIALALITLGLFARSRKTADGKPSWLPFPIPTFRDPSPPSFQNTQPPAQNHFSPPASQGPVLNNENRSRLLNKVINQVGSFHQYYEKLGTDERREIESLLAGPAFERVMSQYRGPRMKAEGTISEPNEKSLWHECQFEEFVSATKWQSGEFFGFLSQLSNEKLLGLVGFESDKNVCIMIHFMQPEQSAYVLDHMTGNRRTKILSHLGDIHQIPLTEIARIETQIREIVHRLPNGMLGPGRQEVDLLGQILSATEKTEELLEVIEKTNPGIYPQLKKFNFSLEDAASLPDNFLRKVVAELDNNELGMALAGSSPSAREVIMDSLSDKRKQLLEAQIPIFKSESPERLSQARRKVNQKIREKMA